MVNLFNGIVRPYSDYPVFWKYWMYYVNPVTWWLRGVISSVFPAVEINCTSTETTHFDPPPGSTCSDYANDFVKNIAGAGYLLDPNATSDCQYCPFRDGVEYMHTLNVHDGDKWRRITGIIRQEGRGECLPSYMNRAIMSMKRNAVRSREPQHVERETHQH